MTDSMTMVERVARAILKTRFYDCEPEMYESLEAFYLDIDPDHVLEAHDEARAAIMAMREPAGGVLTAVERECGADARSAWCSGIDAALRSVRASTLS